MTPDIITKGTMTAVATAATTPSISKAIYTVSSTTRTATISATATSTSSASASASTTSIVQRHRLTIEKLRHRVHQILKCVINLHIDILVNIHIHTHTHI